MSKLHWNEMERPEQRKAASALAEVGAMHVVAVGSPVPRRRQERARAKCLAKLVEETRGFGLENLVLEGRTAELDRKDRKVVAAVRRSLPKGSHFPQYEHQVGTEARLLWIADLVAGVVRADRDGEPEFKQIMAEQLYEIDVRTDC